MEDKIVVRNRFLQQRNKLDKEIIQTISVAVLSNLLLVDPFMKAETIHCFLTAADKNEINTEPIIDWMKQNKKKIVIPRIDVNNSTLSHIEYGTESGMNTNKWGIREPVGGQKVEIEAIDVVLVPMIAADRHKNRLGYGKGFYDRFLSDAELCKIGILGQQFIQDELLPVNDYDIPMDIIVSDREIYY